MSPRHWQAVWQLPFSWHAVQLVSATGLECGSALPLCPYTLNGTGAEGPIGTIEGGGGVTSVGGSVATMGEDWNALGLMGCTGDGFLRVTIADERLDVAVDCTA